MSQFLPTLTNESDLDAGILGRLHTHLRTLRANRSKTRDRIYLELLWNGPISVSALTSRLEGNASRTSVYRTMRAFSKLSVAYRLPSGEFDLTDRFKQHHHYLICRSCGRRTGFYDRPIEQALARFAGRRHFALEEHVLELEGVCRLCHENGVKPRAALGFNLLRSPGR